MFQFLAEIAIGVVSKVPGPGLGYFLGGYVPLRTP